MSQSSSDSNGAGKAGSHKKKQPAAAAAAPHDWKSGDKFEYKKRGEIKEGIVIEKLTESTTVGAVGAIVGATKKEPKFHVALGAEKTPAVLLPYELHVPGELAKAEEERKAKVEAADAKKKKQIEERNQKRQEKDAASRKAKEKDEVKQAPTAAAGKTTSTEGGKTAAAKIAPIKK